MSFKSQFVAFLICLGTVIVTEAFKVGCNNGKEHNRNLVLEYFQLAFGDLEYDQAAEKYLSPNLIQHNPNIGDGSAAFVAFAKKNFKGAVKKRVDIRRSASDKGLVWLHARVDNLGMASPMAVVKIYRLECSKIVEAWGVDQVIQSGTQANTHPYF